MKVQRIEQILIRRTHPKFKLIDQQCFHSKNLYNEANYILRQEFINNNKYISYYDMNKDFKTHENYKLTFSQPANCTLRLLDKNWKSYFAAIKDWKKNPNKYLGYDYEKSTVYIRNRLMNDYDWKCRCLGRPIQVRFIPRNNCYMMEIVYETEIEETNVEVSNRIASIDLGVNNLATVTNNIGLNPFIINGKPLKSINQQYNKKLAEEKSRLKKENNKDWSDKLDCITLKRQQRIKNYMHNASSTIIKWCIENKIDTLVVGKNNEWKQESDMCKRVNQNFVMIPYQLLLKQLKYKCENAGIKYAETEESYTSGTSFLDEEEPVKENYNKNRRIHRGLFKSNSGFLINSDVNGSYQIMKKVFPNAISRYGIESVLTPKIVNVVYKQCLVS